MSELVPKPPTPKSRLAHYRVLSPTAAVRVSPLCLGAMNIGDAWSGFMGSMSKESSFELLDAFYDKGGNFIDTACNYQETQSEQWIGEWMTKRKNRDDMVIATKYSTSPFQLDQSKINVNRVGNARKNLHVSVQQSLDRLQTSYIDILYVHWWDYSASVQEIMNSLHFLVQQGKVLYLGISDTPAWIVSKANQYARDFGLTPFSVYQGEWSITKRDFERDIIPMCKSENMGFAIWGSLGGGRYKTEEQIKEAQKTGDKGRNTTDTAFGRGALTDIEKKVIAIMDRLAKEKGSSVTGIALSYIMHKAPYVFPIVGGRKVSQLEENVDALATVRLSPEELKELEDASPIDLGFPHSFIGNKVGDNFLLNAVAKVEWVTETQPILPNPSKK